MIETFIFETKIDTDLCDQMVSEIDKNVDNLVHDEFRQYYRYTSDNLSQPLFNSIAKELDRCLDEYHEKYFWCLHGSTPVELSRFNLQKYFPDNAYGIWHVEDGGPVSDKPQRKLTWMTYLNDIHTGGETQFLYQSKAYLPRKGSTLIWPAGWTHPHRGQPAPKETKYIATGWFNFLKEEITND